MSEKPVPKSAKPDLDFVRYADDIQRSTSLKKYIESGKEQRDRLRKRTKDRVQTSDLSHLQRILYCPFTGLSMKKSTFEGSKVTFFRVRNRLICQNILHGDFLMSDVRGTLVGTRDYIVIMLSEVFRSFDGKAKAGFWSRADRRMYARS